MPIINDCDCYRCGACMSECPEGAITMTDRVVIDSGRCKGCGECAEICPAGAILMDF